MIVHEWCTSDALANLHCLGVVLAGVADTAQHASLPDALSTDMLL